MAGSGTAAGPAWPEPLRPQATTLAERALAPDLARGVMLLLIALANAHVFLYGRPLGIRGYPIPESLADQVVTLVQMTLVDGRAYPMFAFLFGYGIVQLLRRNTARGISAARARQLVRRRGGWMILIGFLHALLLFSGDIVGAYGLLAVVLAGVIIRATDRRLLITVGLWTVLVAAFGLAQGLPGPDQAEAFLPSMGTTDPLAAAGLRVWEWVGLTAFQSLFVLVPAILLGVWAARRRLLDEPQRYRTPLRWLAVFGIGLAAAGGLPMALMAAGWWPDPALWQIGVAGSAHALSGYLGGVGYAALAGLVAIHVQARPAQAGTRRQGVVLTALVACGQRSLTCYLLQSVVFVAVLAAYGGGLGNRFGIAATAVLAIATWTGTVLLAEFMRRRDQRGPAELLLRRLTYGRP